MTAQAGLAGSGGGAAIAVTFLVFGVSHVKATYEFPGGRAVLGVMVALLSVTGAYSIYKTESLQGLSASPMAEGLPTEAL